MTDDRILLPVTDAADLAMTSRSALYLQVAQGQIETVSIGGRIRIRSDWFRKAFLLPEPEPTEMLPNLPISRVAHLLSVGQGTVRKLIRDGHLKPIVFARRPRIRLADLQAFVDKLPANQPSDLRRPATCA